jgi:hypothetical protein
MARSRRFLASVAACVLPWLAGCGGSDGGGSTTVVTVAHWNGHYHHVAIDGPTAGAFGPTVLTYWGVAAFDGAGSLETTVTLNGDGSVSPGLPIRGFDSDYTVAPDREIVIEALAVPALRGGISFDGDVAIASSVAAGAGPSLRLFGRRRGTFRPFPLTGTWRVCALNYLFGATLQGAFFGSVVFDDTGSGTMTAGTNAEGTIFGAAAAAVSYGVAADGTMQFDFGGGLSLEGGLVRGGNVILLAGGTLDTQNPSLFVLVREAPEPSLASLQGGWFLAGWQFDVAGGVFAGVEGRAVADAVGNLTADLVRNTMGTYTALPPQSATWSLGAGGALTLTLGAGDVLAGGLSPEHDFAVVSGGTNPGSNTSLFVLLR